MMSFRKNGQTPRSVSILALGDTMWFMAACWFGFWIGTRLRDGEFNDSMIVMSAGSFVYGHIMKLIGTIMERLENAGY